jgi:ribosome-associated translation inhibitor RaiA
MPFSDERPALRIEFDAPHGALSDPERERMSRDADSLSRQVANFPTANLHVLIERNQRTNDFTVKTSLLLPGTDLVASDHDPSLHAAYERCLGVLDRELEAYKGRLGRLEERSKLAQGTHQRLEPDRDPDLGEISAAVEAGDYTAFREATLPFEEPLRMRVGRWVERYPDTAGRIGHGLTIADLVEDVFLTAFDRWPSRPVELRMGDWLESLIDLAVKAVQKDPDGELENIRMARTLRGVTPHPEES